MRRRRHRGFYLALEGLDGVGKTTQTRLLAATLEEQGYRVVLTREPTDGPYGQEIRRLRTEGRGDMTPAQELALYEADRRQQVAEVLRPALEAGAVVITDRAYFSSMAYQGALGLDPAAIRRAAEAYAPIPDLTIILTLPFPDLLARLARRGGARDIYEQEDYLRRVGAIYDTLTGPEIVRLDSRPPVAEVQRSIRELVEPRLQAAALNEGPA